MKFVLKVLLSRDSTFSVREIEMFNRRAVFLDRDGTLIKAIMRPDFVKKITAPFSLEELEFFPDVSESLEMLREADFLRIIVTNQPDVRHGYLSEQEWRKIHNRVVDRLNPDDVFMCRHIKDDKCPFKKPSGQMLKMAADNHGIDLAHSYMIGDTCNDMWAGWNAGCRVIMLNRPYNINDECDNARANSLREAVELILNGHI